MHFRVVFLMMSFGLVGCATLHPRAQADAAKIDFFGEAGEVEEANAKYREAVKAALEKLEEPSELAGLSKKVTVLEKTLPEGVEVSNDVIKTAPDSGLTVIGTIQMSPNVAVAFGFPDYSSTVRKVACYPQAPLIWVTLGVWAIFVPTSYPCWGKSITPAEGYGLLRAHAEAAGANLVILRNVSKTEDSFGTAAGYLLRGVVKEKAKPAPASAETLQHKAPIAQR
ncbi:MAG: hypothetical protein K1X64_00415 [Myxococcaceae bacterium]|nr:hypothetical protein [Myxococcaceae bacterium]